MAQDVPRHAPREAPTRWRRALNVVEGNRGLFDGLDAAGTHSTAALAKLLDAPVLLVVNVRKMTGTAAALVRGCQALDPALRIAGVVLNHVGGPPARGGGARSRSSSCAACPCVGAIPRLDDAERAARPAPGPRAAGASTGRARPSRRR